MSDQDQEQKDIPVQEPEASPSPTKEEVQVQVSVESPNKPIKVEEIQANEQKEEEQQKTQQILQVVQQDQFDEQDTTPIDIRIHDAVEKGSSLKKFTVYNLKGSDKLGEFDIYRRYNEFHALREVLVQRWPGIFIPPIPEKSIGGSHAEIVVERTKLLNIFLAKLSHYRYLYYSEEFQAIFIRSKDQDVGKVLQQNLIQQLQSLPKLSSGDLVDRYQRVFHLGDASDPTQESNNKMVSFQVFLKKIQAQLKQQLEQSKALINSRKLLREQMIISFQSHLPIYERDVMNDCVTSHKKLIFANPSAVTINEQITILKENVVNSLEKLQDLTTTEQRDLEAFLQAIQTRENMVLLKVKIEQQLKTEQEELLRLMQGKLPLKASITKMSPEELKVKLEAQIIETSKEAENQRILYKLVSLILTSKQIDQYKREKIHAYRQILNEMAKMEIDYNTQSNEFWAAIQVFTSQLQQEQ